MVASETGLTKILLTVQHPGHVHFFRNAYQELRDDGHEVAVVARSESLVEDLLMAYDIEYTVLVEGATTLPSLVAAQFQYEAGVYRFAREFSPDIISGIGGVAAAHVARLLDIRSVVFTDTEHATISNTLAFPFADLICTPDCFQQDLGTKQYQYPGYHELAYLAPDRFTPDPSVVESVGLEPEETFVVLRITDWNALHDIGQGGLDDAIHAVDNLESAGARVLISSANTDLPSYIESRRVAVGPEKLHDLLAYATLFVGEGATTATESAVLGTPAIYINTLTAGTLTELEERYGLLFGFNGENRHRRGLERALEILEVPDYERWEQRRERLLTDKCDPTEIVTQLLTEQRTPKQTEVV